MWEAAEGNENAIQLLIIKIWLLYLIVPEMSCITLGRAFGFSFTCLCIRENDVHAIYKGPRNSIWEKNVNLKVLNSFNFFDYIP